MKLVYTLKIMNLMVYQSYPDRSNVTKYGKQMNMAHGDTAYDISRCKMPTSPMEYKQVQSLQLYITESHQVQHIVYFADYFTWREHKLYRYFI